MAVTFSTTYRETLSPETVEKIDGFLESQYAIEDILTFIDENSEEDFRRYYEDYVDLGEIHGYEPVDAFVKLNRLADLDCFENAYIGEYSSPGEMAEDYIETNDSLSYYIVVDYSATAEYLIDHDVDQVGNFYFRASY
jgi:hypothetical protein